MDQGRETANETQGPHDATGFVGWLHAHLARATGAGHIVVCGASARPGGGVEHDNVIPNNGDRAGQTVFHAHVHIVPKPSGAMGLVAQVGPGRVDQAGMLAELRGRLGG
jgi:hypothetical protein